MNHKPLPLNLGTVQPIFIDIYVFVIFYKFPLYPFKRRQPYTFSGVLQLEVLIRKLLSIDALATSSITSGEVTTLAHETWNDAMETAALKSKALLTSTEGSEIFSRLGDNISSQLEIIINKGNDQFHPAVVPIINI